MTKEQVKGLQRSLNHFTNKYLKKVGPIRVDGELGHASRRRIRTVKYYLGYEGKAQQRSKITSEFVRRLRHPRSLRYSTPAMIARGIRRRRKQRKLASRVPTTGTSTFDGRPCAAWIKPYLEWARKNGWRGTLVSGYRDPVYSERLCYSMCGHPSCPGRCAGRSSNHSGSTKPRGAIDVSDYSNFGRVISRCPYQPRLYNGLGARDPVHFSATGN